MGLIAGCAQCEKFRQAGLERCPKCGCTFAAAEAPMLVLRNAASGQTWELSEGRLVIGRKDALAQASLEPGDTPVVLDDRLVSRRHAVIQAEAGTFSVTDAESRDGTHLNEREITETTAIQEGDQLRFGDTVLLASFERAARPVAAQAADAERTIFQTPAPAKPPARPAPKPAAAAPDPTTPEPAAPAPRPATPVPTPAILTPKAARLVQPEPAPPARSAAAAEPTPLTLVPGPTTPASDKAAPAPKPLAPAPVKPQTAPPPRDIEQELSIVLDMFERNGGRPALQTLLAHARRVEATPEGADTLQTLVAWLPTACRMLETELMLIDLLSARVSDALR